MPAETAPAEPKHPLDAMTTYELKDYRRQLESALAFFDGAERDRLRASLDGVLAEQEERVRIAHAR
jgi:hypothetical protein